jgi:antitoxin VapB
MTHVAKLFINGRSQAVRLPAAFRFDADEVYVRQDPETGDVILSRKPPSWDQFFILVKAHPAQADLFTPAERDQSSPEKQERDPFEGWAE